MSFLTVVKTWRSDVYDFIDPKVSMKGTATGKVVIVTDHKLTGYVLQWAVARAFATAGAKTVILTSRTTSDLENTKKTIEKLNPGIHVFAYTLDVSNGEAVKEVFVKIKREVGVLDILVNNAGIPEHPTCLPLSDSDPSGWWKVWEINLKGTYLCTKEFINAVGSRGGTIVNTSSLGAVLITPTMSSYQIGKLALIKFTEFIEAENGAKGVRAFSYHPGGIVTDLAKQLPAAIRQTFKDTVELAAGAVVCLASERFEYLRGRFITANWDLEELKQRKEEIVAKNLFKSGVNFA